MKQLELQAGKREDDGLTFDLESDEAAAALWLTTPPWLGIRQAASDQYNCSSAKVLVRKEGKVLIRRRCGNAGFIPRFIRKGILVLHHFSWKEGRRWTDLWLCLGR
jgi:hypothetical protein